MAVGGNFTSCNCGPDNTACASPTEPLATVGLCLADGSPIAVTVVRDCAGTTTSEGWINLTTGAWSAGAPPAGTIACGDSRSIQVSGTFCDVDNDGQVLGLVLVEYSYTADGSIDGVRLVDAVTGDTYIPQGTVTTCPAGVAQPERDMVQLCDTNDDESGAILTVPFLRDFARDENGAVVGHSDYTLEGVPYTPVGTVGVCQPQQAEPCASTVTTLRLCDLNPDATPDSEGKRCAVTFLRHLVHDCSGALVETRDTVTDGTTPYTPVRVVDCGSGGVPAMVEVPWEVVGIEPDPDSPEGRGFLFSLSPIDDPDTVGVVKVTTTATANTACPATPPDYAFRNPCTYTFEPDQALQDAATYVRCDLQDFDTFEPVTGLNPPPSRLGGTAYWDGTTIRPTESNGTGSMYYDGPPPVWSYRVGNTGGGNSCSALSFAAVSLCPEGCCTPCGGNGGEAGTGRTVQEVCVIANAAPADVMTWTRVIEDGGAVIYYLDQTGVRYDDTLPAGHQIVPCPAEEVDGCTACETVTLCDVQPEEESPGAPLITFTELRLSELDDGPTSGTLDNGVGFTVSCGDWLEPQKHYTIYPVGGPGEPACDQVWTFDQPVYLRLGLRGFNVSPRECIAYEAPGTTWSVEFLHPNHRAGADPDSICGLGSATDESIIRTDSPVTELTIRATTNMGAGRGLGLLHVGLLADPQPEPGAVTPFLRTTCRDCQGEVMSTTDTSLEGAPYTPSGLVTVCDTGRGGETTPGRDVEVLQLCDAPEVGDPVPFLRHLVYTDDTVPPTVLDTELDGVTPYMPAGDAVDCAAAEPCRDSSSTLLCDTSAADLVTVFDPANRPDDDGWEVVSFTGERPGAGPEAPMPYPARYGTPYGYPALGARADQYGGYGGGSWQGYDTAPVRWVLRKEFIAPEDGVAIAQSVGFRGDGGARVRINGLDAGMYGQWNQPATSGTAEIPVTAGANVVEIEVRDVNGINNVVGRLDIALPKTVQFLRRQVTDCETGEVVSTTDTTLDGEPYEVAGEVGQCTPTAECCEQPPPELRVDVESDVMCIRAQDGEVTGQVLVERVYDDQSGDRVVQRLADPTTGDEVTLPDGAELVLCQEPACPAAFSTECVGEVARTEAGYDNTSLINGVPGKCGSVQGPNGQFPCQPASGGYTIVSWIVDGEEIIGEDGGRAFAGGPCGEGAPGNLGMHHNWGLALTNLDPSGATWSAQSAEGCAWFVGSTGGTQTVYGPMIVADDAGQRWTLGPAQQCEETQYTKVYSQECDGTVSVSWLDAQGVPTDAPTGDLVPCGTGCGGGGGSGLDVEVVQLCDVQVDSVPVPFLRHITYGTAGQVSVVVDTALDAFAPYTPTGVVGPCDRPAPVTVLEECRCDDADGDGVGDTPYLELIAVYEDGTLTTVGTYAEDLSGPYEPVLPVPCDQGADDADEARTVQAHRVQLAPGASWSAGWVPTLQSVTLTAHGGTGTITADGEESTLHEGESVSWSVTREGDAILTGPLLVTAATGTVAVAYTRTVTP